MSREIVNNSQSDRAIPAESQRLYGLVEREISDRDLQMKIQEQISTMHRDVKAELERLEHQVGEAHHKITKKEGIIEKQNREIDHKTEQIIELKKEICVLQRRVRQALDDKQSRVESLEAKLQEQVNTVQMMHRDFLEKEEYLLRQNSSIAAQLSLIERERDELKKTLEPLEYQEQQSQVESLEALQLENFAPEPEELFFPALEPPVVLTQENFAPEPEELFFPALEPPVVLTQENFAPEPEELFFLLWNHLLTWFRHRRILVFNLRSLILLSQNHLLTWLRLVVHGVMVPNAYLK
ncbi:peroxisomal and mitochondrial division factor 2-like isoform X2 [Astatotilapia calliptera]|uniref:peroxisomal and mitochondrial division factor 2-like isoform X2 n=1 Tax=Astatotilapia calliptera TaxID=8154 RepID=UPI000E3FECD6|nr:peroxisomal and mitochondrial division factor 2-like isoform X2 [Astatotilapia calliptera]